VRRSRLAIPSLLLVAALACGCTPSSPPSDRTAATKSTAPASAQSPADEPPWQVAGTTVEGRPIRVQTLGHGPRKVLFIGGIHGDEAEGSYTTAQLPEAFNEAGLAEIVTLTIIEDANPDGRAAGTRENAHGVDINRSFPASNFDPAGPDNGRTPLSQPESRTVVNVLNATDPDLVVVVHSWQNKQFINFDGPAREIADRFALASGLPVAESSSFAPTPGSLGSYVGRDRQIPLITIEFLQGSDPKSDWEKIREALIAAIRGSG